MFHSIRSKILGLCLGGMFILALAMGTLTMFAMDRLTKEQEIETMNRKAEYAASAINLDLMQVQSSVQFTANHMQRRIASPDELTSAERRAKEAEIVAASFATDMEGTSCVTSYYLCFSETFGGAAQGFHYERRWSGDPFQNFGMYDVMSYPVDDPGHAAWFWNAVEAKSFVWSKPFFSEGQRYVVSCSAPVYVDGMLAAVMGVDVLFSDILDRAERLKIYESGKVLLFDTRGEIIYDKEHPEGQLYDKNRISNVQGWSAWELDSTGDRLIGFTRGGVDYDAAFAKLRNGMKLLVYAPTSEVFGESRRTLHVLAIASLILWIIVAFLSALMADRMTKSLHHLALGAHEISRGNFDVEVNTKSKDEIGTLARAFRDMLVKVRNMMQYLKDENTHDALTGLLNRLGMDEQMKAWMAHHEGEPAAFVMLDLDNFKFVNDLYGHAAGDAALCALADQLAHHFGSSAYIGRNGGDEFAVFLPQTSPADAERIVRTFSEMPKMYDYDGETRSFTVSIGYVTYPGQASELSELFKYADAALYNVKLKGKSAYERYEPHAASEILCRSQLGFNLENIAVNMPGGLLIYEAIDRQKILYANRELTMMFGCNTLEEFLDYTKGSFRGLVHPDDLERVETSIWQQIEGNLDSMDFVRFRILTKQGMVRRVVDAGRLVRTALYGDIFYCMLIEEKE